MKRGEEGEEEEKIGKIDSSRTMESTITFTMRNYTHLL